MQGTFFPIMGRIYSPAIRDKAGYRKDYGQSFELTGFRKYVHMGLFACAAVNTLIRRRHSRNFLKYWHGYGNIISFGLSPLAGGNSIRKGILNGGFPGAALVESARQPPLSLFIKGS
jgi:hypothetical protein